MDIRRSINTRVWSDDWFEGLTPSEKLVWLYLLTNAQTNMLGIYEVSIKRVQFETGIPKETIEKALKGFERVNKAFYWDGFIVLPNWMKNQSLNSNMLVSAERLFSTINNGLRTKLIENGFESFESLLKGCQTLPKKEKEIEKEIEKEGEGENLTLPPLEISEDEKTLQYLKSEYPKFFIGKYPLTVQQHNRLKNKYGRAEVKRIYDAMHAKADYNKKYDDHYKTAMNWLKRDNPGL